jgi:hypothetical protein
MTTREEQINDIRKACIAANPEISIQSQAALDREYERFLMLCEDIANNTSKTPVRAAMQLERVKQIAALISNDRPIRLADILVAI